MEKGRKREVPSQKTHHPAHTSAHHQQAAKEQEMETKRLYDQKLLLAEQRRQQKELQDKDVLAQCHVNIVQMIDTAVHTNYQSELKYLLEHQGRLD